MKFQAEGILIRRSFLGKKPMVPSFELLETFVRRKLPKMDRMETHDELLTRQPYLANTPKALRV